MTTRSFADQHPIHNSTELHTALKAAKTPAELAHVHQRATALGHPHLVAHLNPDGTPKAD